MADIVQAAKWMQDGKLVRRAIWDDTEVIRIDEFGCMELRENGKFILFDLLVDSLLATDWETAP